jgi:hypothetical protein
MRCLDFHAKYNSSVDPSSPYVSPRPYFYVYDLIDE